MFTLYNPYGTGTYLKYRPVLLKCVLLFGFILFPKIMIIGTFLIQSKAGIRQSNCTTRPFLNAQQRIFYANNSNVVDPTLIVLDDPGPTGTFLGVLDQDPP
jgi:hypothetical protein